MQGVPGPTTTRAQKLAAKRALIATKGAELRSLGWTTAQIARALKCSPATVSMYLPRGLRSLDHHELADRRKAAVFDLDCQHLTSSRRVARAERLLALHDVEMHARTRLAREWRNKIEEIRHCEMERKRLERQEAAYAKRGARAKRRYLREVARSIHQPQRLDAPVGYGILLHEIVASGDRLSDPHAHVEAQMLDDLLGDLTMEDVARMDESTLELLQDRIRDAGFAPRGVQRKERERLRTPERHRGAAPPMTFQPIHSKRRSRKDQRALMTGKRVAKQARQDYYKGRKAA